MTQLRAALLAALCVASATLTLRTAPAQGTGDSDRIFYRDRTKDGKVEVQVGELKESASGVQIYGPDKKLRVTVPPTEVVRIEYSVLKNVDRDAYANANALDAAGDYTKAATAFADLILKAGASVDERTLRILTYRQLLLNSRVNNAELDDGKFAAVGAPLAEKLAAFARAHPKNWEYLPSARVACRILAQIRKPAEAALLAKEIGDNTNLGAELQADARCLEIGYQFMASSKGAAGGIAELQKSSATLNERQKEKLAIYNEVLNLPDPETVDPKWLPDEAAAKAAAAAKRIREAVAKVEATIAKAKDASARAAGYNAIGETYLRHGLPRDAMWAFLWVDTVYNQDRDEQVKALSRLVQIYKSSGEEDREKIFRERMTKAR